jgi:hypothetical protein
LWELLTGYKWRRIRKDVGEKLGRDLSFLYIGTKEEKGEDVFRLLGEGLEMV